MKCKNCSSEVQAEIKKIMLDKMKLERPCWYCSNCDLSVPAKKDERGEWVDRFKWNDSSIYGLELRKDYCIGCQRRGTLYAGTEIVLGESYFPFHTERYPVWVCYSCGFTFKCLELDRKLWEEAYHLWAE